VSVYIFIGPTISVKQAERELNAHFLPPVKQGDVYRVALKSPRIIGVIDGHFEQVPAVWHKEILWAMSHGVHVFGASSMGALRAAELWQYGMKGVGQIFEDYRDGVLVDDDEVALRHGPPEMHYVALSDPMVNIRTTLKAARDESIISETTRVGLVRVGKQLFYPLRSYQRVLEGGNDIGLPISELSTLENWLPTGRVDQKYDDAVAMLREIREFVASDPPPKAVVYSFRHTDMWEAVTRSETPRD